MNLREQLFQYVKNKYNAAPEYLWMRFPDYAVFRHADNGKWFGIVMNVSGEKLGIDSDDKVDILNVKLPDPLLAEMLIQQFGFFRGYHMSRGNWVSILLDGSVPFEEVCRWLEESYLTTASRQKKQKMRPPKEWIVPSNPKFYDIIKAFEEAEEIDWKQGAGIKKGDTVYMYVGAPVSAILYQCEVTDANIPYEYDDGNVHMKEIMKIKLLKRYSPDRFTFQRLKEEYNIFAVRGPRGVSHSLSEDLNF